VARLRRTCVIWCNSKQMLDRFDRFAGSADFLECEREVQERRRVVWSNAEGFAQTRHR